DVVIEILAQTLPELERMIVDRSTFLEEIVGPDDGRVASGVAATDPPLFKQSHVPDALLFREVIRGAEAMTAAADNDHVVGGLRIGRAPLLRPGEMPARGVRREIEDREARHFCSPHP